MKKKYKYSRKQWLKEHGGVLFDKAISDLLATVPTKECELCLEDSGNHTFDCPRHKRNLNPTPPQLPEIEIPEYLFDHIDGNNWAKKIIDRLNLLSQRVCKEK